MQGREVGRETVDDARAPRRLHLLPRLLHAVAVQMRVSRLHLGDERVGDVVHVERTAFFRENGVKQDLQQKVAELLAEFGVVAASNGVVDLVGLLDQIGSKGLVRLRGVPVATGAKVAHQRQRIFKRRFHLHSLHGSGILPAL